MYVFDKSDFFLPLLWSIVNTFCTTIVPTLVVCLTTAVINIRVPIKTLAANIAETSCTSVRNELLKLSELVAFATDSTLNSFAFWQRDLTEFNKYV